jgi:hypothetical protein
VRGDEDDRQAGIVQPDLVEQLQPVHARHRVVGDDHVGPVQRAERGPSGGDRRHLVTGALEQLAEREQDRRIVVDQEHSSHALPPG